MCRDYGYAYTKVVFSDESIRQIRVVFPLKPTAVVFGYGERINEDPNEGIRVVAEPLPDK